MKCVQGASSFRYGLVGRLGAGRWCKQEALAQAREEVQLEVVVWDRAPGHRVRRLERTVERIFQPPYSPELQPVERLFEAIRCQVEERVYGFLEARMQAVEELLWTWQQHPEKVRFLTAWPWIREAFNCPDS